MRVFVLGDSTVHGTLDKERLGWVGRLPLIEDVEYFNLGVPGQTMSQILARAFHEVSARIVPYHDSLILISASLNDLSLDNDDKLRTDPETLKAQVTALIEAMARLAPVLVLGPLPIDETYNPYYVSILNEHRVWKNAIIAEANEHYSAICAALNIPYLDLYDALRNDPSYKESISESDGLHPDTMGYVGIAEYVSSWKAFRSKLPDAQTTKDAKKESK